MADKKLKQLIWDCQKAITAYLPTESGISEHADRPSRRTPGEGGAGRRLARLVAR
jgi:hypothetical protein